MRPHKQRPSIFVGMAFGSKEQPELKRRCDARWQAISEVCRNQKLNPRRVDKDPGAHEVVQRVKSLIREARYCIVDLSEERPNVYYEIGWADGVEYPSNNMIFVAAEGTTLHFDLSHRSVRTYGDTEQLREILEADLKGMLSVRQLKQIGGTMSRTPPTGRDVLGALVRRADQDRYKRLLSELPSSGSLMSWLSMWDGAIPFHNSVASQLQRIKFEWSSPENEFVLESVRQAMSRVLNVIQRLIDAIFEYTFPIERTESVSVPRHWKDDGRWSRYNAAVATLRARSQSVLEAHRDLIRIAKAELEM